MAQTVAMKYLVLLRLHRAALRGSVVRGEERATSDIDILVEISPAKKNYSSFLDLADYLEELFEGRKIDLVTTAAISKYILPCVVKEVQHIEVG